MNRKVIAVLMIVLAGLMAFAACAQEEPEGPVKDDEYLARYKSPLLGTWECSTMVDGKETVVTMAFFEDGSVTSRTKEGTDGFAVFDSVTWTYDTEKMMLHMHYIDFRGIETDYDMALNVVSDDYIILKVQGDVANGVTKMSLTRKK